MYEGNWEKNDNVFVVEWVFWMFMENQEIYNKFILSVFGEYECEERCERIRWNMRDKEIGEMNKMK